ncbi:YggS family pyridoxal phosphate-dependent enzyme [Phytoactinopolyspora endophytica]|uniref:YggS family pyridoxal phosphate-dependent enzyme n=1 Tax=Phytoactinopolyspora endophytica TaxID=1642495 RepID=UPI00101DB9E1|nr:YggS family pyridoxal phosphate-dependent enzyme [Phytoactinopolyspora endophytica]
MLNDDDILANLGDVRARIARAVAETQHEADHVRLLLATKTVSAERIATAVGAGEHLIGENRVQELAQKDEVLSALPCERHLIGHLQTNKVNQALAYVTCIQSLDRVDLADRLQRRLDSIDSSVDVLLQVNTSGEISKFGVSPDDALTFARETAKRDRIRIRGLMTIGLPAADPDLIRPGYRRLREVRDQIRDARIDNVHMGTLSMGMSGDLDIAIEEGATMVRVGSAVFGVRPRP